MKRIGYTRHFENMKRIHISLLSACMFALLLLLSACGTSATQIKQQQPIVISKNFQQVSPVPTVPAYRCGSWASNNAPNSYSVIYIYSKLVTKDVNGVPNATASATVHFSTGDVTLDQQPVSDSGGYVSFTLPLAGRQARLTPATVDVSFSVSGKTIQCTSAFFTPN